MNNEDRMALLRDAVIELGSQAKVGRRLGYSSGTISQVLSDNCPLPGGLEPMRDMVGTYGI